jgi:hypothetical protein
VRNTGPWPTLTTIHEAGHFIDLEGIGAKGNFASVSGEPDMREVMAAIERTEAVKHLRGLLGGATPGLGGYYQYLLDPRELWARAYAQFIAQRSGFAALRRDLRKATEAEAWRQWERSDFAPVDAAIEVMFRKLGWTQ